MAARARKPPADDELGVLLDLQRKLGEVADGMRLRRAARARRRGRQRAYAPPETPGPKPSALDIARAKRLWREIT